MKLNGSRNPYLVWFGLIIVALTGLATYFHVIDQDYAFSMLHESGLIEISSACGYFLCVAVMVLVGGQQYLRRHYPLTLLVTLFGLRELDFDKRFTETGLLQSRIFTSPDVVLSERIIGLIVMVCLAVLVIMTLRRYLMVVLSRLRRFDAVGLGTLMAASFMVLSKSIDGIGRKLEPLGVIVSEQIHFSAIALEEVLEFGIPAILIIITFAYLHQQAAEGPRPTAERFAD